MIKILTIVGARPQFIKAAMVSRAIVAHNYQGIITKRCFNTLNLYDHFRCFRMTRYWRNNILATSCFIIATFPLFGNAIAYPAETNVRRLWQIGLLLLGLVGVGGAFFWDTIHRPRAWVHRRMVRALLLSLIVFGLVCVFNTWHQNVLPDGIMLLKAASAAGWLSLTAAMFAYRAHLWSYRSAVAHTELSLRPFKIFLVCVSLLAVLKAWWVPPPINEIYLSFGGSYIQSGMCAVIGYFTVLLILPYWQGLLASLPFGYLFVLSTSRMAWISGACLFAFLWFVWWRNERQRHLSAFFVATAKIMGLVAALILLIIAPIYSASTYYPYIIKTSSQLDQPTPQITAFNRTLEFTRRSSRLLRIIPGGHWITSQLRAIVPKKYVESIDSSSQPSDIRTVLSGSTFQGRKAGIIEYLIGAWPTPFREKIGATIYSYPHNSILETAYYWGWPLAVLIWMGFLSLVVFGILRLSFQRTGLQSILTVIALEYALLMQVSGAIEDFSHLLVLAWIMFVIVLLKQGNEC